MTENISNFQENAQDRSWSITSYHHYEEIITEEKINDKSDLDSLNMKNESQSIISHESSIHLGNEHDINSLESRINKDNNQKDESVNDEIKLLKKDIIIKNNSDDHISFISESKNSDHSLSAQNLTEVETTMENKNSKPEDDAKDINKNIKSLSESSSASKENSTTFSSSNKEKPRKKKYCSDTSTSVSSSSCNLDTSLSQGCPKKDLSDSPLVESIDRIKHILSDLIKELPKNQNSNDLNNQNKSNKNKDYPLFQSDHESKPSIRFVFPQINLPSKTLNNPCQNKLKDPLSKNKTPKLNYDKNAPCSKMLHQKSQDKQQPVWVLTRVTKHVTRTIRKEILPC